MNKQRFPAKYRHHVWAILGYLGLAFILTYPTIREIGQAIPGDGFDGWQNVWNIWWVKQALLTEGTHPYFTHMVDYPVGVYLYFHTLNIFNGLTFLPVTLNAGNLVAYNVAVLFSFVGGGYGTYLLSLYAMRGFASDPERAADQNMVRQKPMPARALSMHLAAFLGGIVFAFSPYHMAHLLGHMQLISLEWLPFYALFTIMQVSEAQSQLDNPNAGIRLLLRYSLLSAIFLLLVVSCDWYYAFYMVLFSDLYWLWNGLHRRGWLAPALSLAITGIVFLVITAPLLIPMVRESLGNDYMVPPPGSTERLSADLTAFFTPSPLHPLWGDWAATWADRFTASTSERTVFAGFSVLALAIVGLLARRGKAYFWGLSALTFAVLAMGPILHVGGLTTFAGVGPIPLPYALLHKLIPLLRISRSVSRFDVLVMLSLAVLAALGLEYLLRLIAIRSQRQSLVSLAAAGAVLVLCLEFLAAPYPMSFPETQPFHFKVAQEPQEFAMMDVPMDWDRPANLLYQTVHGKPTISGYTSRTNPFSPAWRTPVLQTFRYLGPDINSGDPRALAATVLNDLHVKYVIIHKTDLPPGEYREATLELSDEIFGDWAVLVEDDWLKTYQVPDAVDAPLPYLVLGEGWSLRQMQDGQAFRIISAPSALVTAHLPSTQTVRLEITAYAPDGNGELTLQVEDKVVGKYQIDRTPSTITSSDLLLPGGETLIQIHTDSGSAPIAVSNIGIAASRGQ